MELDDAGVVGVDVRPRHEGAVDLEFVDRQLSQLGQRRVTRPEIVDREPYACHAQQFHVARRGAGVAHHRAFRDLEDEARRGDAVPGEEAQYRIAESRVDDVACREVHGHVEDEVILLPFGHLVDCGAQYPVRQLARSARLLCQRHELARRNRSQPGVIPSHQRLDARDTTRGDCDLRLEREMQFVVLDRATQVRHHFEAPAMFFVAADPEDADAVARLFRVVQRDLGPADHLVGRTALLRAGAQAGPDLELDFHLVDRQRLFDRIDDHGRKARRMLRGMRPRQQHQVAAGAEPGHEFPGAASAHEPFCRLAQHLVGDAMPQGRIELPQVAQVNHHRGHA